ncbi:MAG TPA: AAA family ATPase [Nocardioides sp.]|uniref:ATP-binding protein n=1 Tax=Nocardioides sp. TaxID=35761 RepID=UPI002E30979F|nr:AAA family ATPase [Nocardioides sp.]HEX5088887.1 AAA family ATPase [Nocardioides sp.]
MPQGDVVGRERELGEVSAFLDGHVAGPAGLSLVGEPGIGKSTLWGAAVAGARDRGLLVLSSLPTEAERSFDHIGLGDLFDDVLDEVAPALAAPRRRALEVALLREEAADDPVDRRALGVAVHDLLSVLAQRRPILLAVDDHQWLDPSSSSALSFALRRLAGSPVRVLLSRRHVDKAEPTELERAIGEEHLQHVFVGPLTSGALHRLLSDRLERTYARQTTLRIHERAGGNPFFALELARALGADIDPLRPLPVPDTLDGLLSARLDGLPAATRDALALASAIGTPSLALMERAGVALETLSPAVASHVVELDDGTVRFGHPLLSSVLYRDLGERRWSVHRRIAEIVEDPITRARHLALSAAPPEPRIATVLDDAAALAMERGLSAVGAELAEHAVRLTPAEAVERHPRALTAARAHRSAGEWTRARNILTDLLAEDLGPLRAEVLIELAEFEGLERGAALLAEALEDERAGPALRARIQCRLAWTTRFTKGYERALEHARTALHIADDLDDDALRVEALAILTFLGCAAGDPAAPGHAWRARRLASGLGDEHLLVEARRAVSNVLEVRRRVEELRALNENLYERCHERDELAATDALFALAYVDLWSGRWQLAAEHAQRAHEITVQYGLEVPWIHLPVAVIAAHRGRLALARAHSERSLQLAEEQFGLHTPVHLGTLGFVALQAGDPGAALGWFDEAEAILTRLEWHEPGRRWWVPDHVEALLALDRRDEAVRVVDAWEADARRLRRDWVLAHVTRCRGLIAASRGHVEEAASLLEAALDQHERDADPFGAARALFGLGVVRRRQRRKRDARDAIGAALARFQELDAAAWVERARGELGQIGGRTRTEGLTPAERRVAALVAEGRTNREVAAALMLGERTVESHLSHVYAKLGIRSRAELARRFRLDEQSSGELRIPS